MYNVVNTIGGATMSVHADPRKARMIAAPMEFHRVWPDNTMSQAFWHLPARKWNEEHPADTLGRKHLQDRVRALIAEAERRSADTSMGGGRE